MFAKFLDGSTDCYFLRQLNNCGAIIKLRRNHVRLCSNQVVATKSRRNTVHRVRKIRRKQVCRRKTRLRKFRLIGKKQCTPKGQAQYVNVRGSVLWRRVFLRQTCLRRIFLEPLYTALVKRFPV